MTMTNTQDAYDSWAEQYDTNENKTRDLEGIALKTTLRGLNDKQILEIGSGTGKNTDYLVHHAAAITCVDFSTEMMARARARIQNGKVRFVQADISKPWNFTSQRFDLITFSLVLEHIEHLDHVFAAANNSLNNGGLIYIGELHPFKQYSGSKACFETATGIQVVQCFTHHISEFTQLAKKYRLDVLDVNEFFDEDNTRSLPRIFTILLGKNTKTV